MNASLPEESTGIGSDVPRRDGYGVVRFRRSAFRGPQSRKRIPVLSCFVILVAIASTGKEACLPVQAADSPSQPLIKSRIVSFADAPARQADWGEMRRYFTGETAGTKDVLTAVAVVKPGKTVHHAHRHAEEEYLILADGSGTWLLDTKESPARRGDIMYAEPWVHHGLTNTSSEPLIFVVVRFRSKGVPPLPRPDDRPDELTGPPDTRAAGPRTAKATGRVTIDGRPLAGAAVTFVPKQGRPALGITDTKGEFSLSTFAKNDGAVPGEYSVSFRAQTTDKPENRDRQGSTDAAAIPLRYSDPQTSGIVCVVTDRANVFEFNLTTK